MKSTDIFTSKYLKSADVKAKPLIMMISYVDYEAVGEDKKKKPVLYPENGKPIVLNRTNFEAIEDVLGDSDEWPGHKVRVFCAPTQYQGKRVDGIRVEAIVSKPAAKDDPSDEVAA